MEKSDKIINLPKKILDYKKYFQKNIFDENFLDEKDKALSLIVLSDKIPEKKEEKIEGEDLRTDEEKERDKKLEEERKKERELIQKRNKVIEGLEKKFNVLTIPKFFPIDKKGNVLSETGREDLLEYGVDICEKWNEDARVEVENENNEGNEEKKENEEGNENEEKKEGEEKKENAEVKENAEGKESAEVKK